MTDTTRFETRLTDALGRYADRMPIDVDSERLVRTLATTSSASRGRGLTSLARPRVALAIVALVAASVAGVVLFGGRLQAPVPPVIASPDPSTSAATSTSSPTTSPTVAPDASMAPTPVAALDWTEQHLGSLPPVTSIWRVGEWFVGVGPDSAFADDDQVVAAQFIRSHDGQQWAKIPAPARGMEVETGTVDGDTLTIVGRLGKAADPKRGIWTTHDGANWVRVADVTGLDFGPGRVKAISHAVAGWLALASRWVDAESQDGFMLRSTDGAVWTRQPYPSGSGPYDVAGLVSDGARWLMATEGYEQGKPASLEALTSKDGLTWTSHIVEVLPQPGSADAVTFGPAGFVIVGQILDGEYPHPRAWVSADGATWTSATMEGRPDPEGETGLRSVVGFDGGYFASGYRLDLGPSFWTSGDGSTWAQVDDASGSVESYLPALAASDVSYVAGGATASGGALIWTAPH